MPSWWYSCLERCFSVTQWLQHIRKLKSWKHHCWSLSWARARWQLRNYASLVFSAKPRFGPFCHSYLPIRLPESLYHLPHCKTNPAAMMCHGLNLLSVEVTALMRNQGKAELTAMEWEREDCLLPDSPECVKLQHQSLLSELLVQGTLFQGSGDLIFEVGMWNPIKGSLFGGWMRRCEDIALHRTQYSYLMSVWSIKLSPWFGEYREAVDTSDLYSILRSTLHQVCKTCDKSFAFSEH